MKARPAFNLMALLHSAGIAPRILRFNGGQTIFLAGDAADSTMYVQKGTVKLSVVSKRRRAGAPHREAVVAIVRAGDFFGEACLADQRKRERMATAMSRSIVVMIDRGDMVQVLRAEPALRDRFIEHVLLRNLRAEADLLDQLVSPCEQRLARALLLLAGYGKRCRRPKKVLPVISQSTLAGIVGSSRSRVNYLMNRFERMGFIDTAGGLTVKRSLLRVSQETPDAR